jgi:molybdenum cofactor biosynthesis protein B
MSHEEHQRSAKDIRAGVAVVTLSDTRNVNTDTSGQLIFRLVEEAGHAVCNYQIVPDEPEVLRPLLDALLADGQTDVILTNGGTGIARRDRTVDVVESIVDRPLPGFGELFRMLSWEQVGSAALLSRASAGIARGKPIFAMPGSGKAVELAMTKLILPQLRHVLWELRK